MKFLLFFLCTGLLVSTVGFRQALADSPASACYSSKQSDHSLNRAYQRILTDYASDAVFIRNLKASQNAWIRFRDAEIRAVYPDRGPGYYGSVHGLCVCGLMERLIRERTEQLRAWTEGTEEGDVCGGSVKIIGTRGR